MSATNEAFKVMDEELWDDEVADEDVSRLPRIGEPARHPWWPLLFLALGLYLTASLSVKVWNLYAAVHTFETTRGVTVDKDLPNLLATAPDLERALAPKGGAGPSQSGFPRSHDVAFGALGLALVLLGAGALARGFHRVARPLAAGDESRAFGVLGISPSVITAWAFAEALLVGVVVVVLVAFAYQLVLNLVGGASLSWNLVDRMVDDDVFRVLAWWQ